MVDPLSPSVNNVKELFASISRQLQQLLIRVNINVVLELFLWDARYDPYIFSVLFLCLLFSVVYVSFTTFVIL